MEIWFKVLGNWESRGILKCLFPGLEKSLEKKEK